MKQRMLVVAATLAVMSVGCANSTPVAPDAAGDPHSAAVKIDGTQDQGGRGFTTTLTGAAEVPGPGDPNGGGTARLTVNVGQAQVCFSISVTGIALPSTGAHIHVGEVGDFGAVVVGLTPPAANGTSSGCVDANQDVLKQIVSNAAGYYVNVHTTRQNSRLAQYEVSSPHLANSCRRVSERRIRKWAARSRPSVGQLAT